MYLRSARVRRYVRQERGKMKKVCMRAALAVAVLLFLLNLAACSDGQSPETNPPTPPSQEDSLPDPPVPDLPDEPQDPYPETLFEGKMHNTGKVGMYAEYLGTAERHLPQVSDGGLEKYPAYGIALSATEEEKQAILDENMSLVASPTTYDSMDADGFLYLNGEATGGKLYKHTASVGMYEGDVRDDEPAVCKRLTIRARSLGNHITGLYAPAGEIIKIEMEEDSLAATGGLTVQIGQVLTNGQANNIWLARDFNRMPVISNTMTVHEREGYVGSFLGGPIYIQPVRAGAEFTVTITGGVPYSHFISGATTREEFDRYKDSSAPYFDLEVWDDGVRHSGPHARAAQFDYNQLSQAASLWDKIALVSNKVPAGSPGDTGINFLYDPFIAAGSMVAFVGRYTVNCPLYCMSAALDAEEAIRDASDAFWGCIHEFNHHFQRFGFAPGDEVTNNAVSLVEYSLFTRISAKRFVGGSNEGQYATGWNRYTNPSWVLRQTLANSSPNAGLDTYANLLHAFGQDAFIRATQIGNGSGGADVWYRAVSEATGYDMTYYFKDILHQAVSAELIEEYAGSGPMFVPVASVYQTGRSCLRDGEEYFCRTAQPYEIPTGKPFTLDLHTQIVAPKGIGVKIKAVSAPAHGTLAKKEEGVYVYTPDTAHRESGKIFVTLALTEESGAFDAGEVTLVIELRQSEHLPAMGEEIPFETDYFYPHAYNYDYDRPLSTEQSLVETNYRPWGKDYSIDVLFDEDDTNFIHSDRTDITAASPFVLTIDLGKTVHANRLTVYGEPSRQYQPKDFCLYGGTEIDGLHLLADVHDAPRSGYDVIADFPKTDLCFCKLVVTDTWAPATKYIAFRRIGLSDAVAGGVYHSPDEEMFLMRGNWTFCPAFSTYGHIYAGQNASLEFSFTGTRFAIFSGDEAGFAGAEILVDGLRAETAGQGENVPDFLSQPLEEGLHTVVLRSKERFSVDSIVLWD